MQRDLDSPKDTLELAAALGAVLDAGAVVLLTGPLGAGKTHFVKGLAAGLGLESARIQSPTFVVAAEYPLPRGGRLVHVDCYRVEDERELEAAGLLDWLGPDACVVAEWGERVLAAWPADHLAVTIERGAADEARRVSMRAQGPRSEALLARWGAALRPGREEGDQADS